MKFLEWLDLKINMVAFGDRDTFEMAIVQAAVVLGALIGFGLVWLAA